ncbi:MMPL family transporter [Streptomyces catenulae]|uniref:MMPL family transporter n=1 Tax=Streptomyces catenulae TaxID=66875 RepID=A0ABV2Z164_9ACTN|nr:MMPL family transporter [Streptomyces catenulae]
MFGFGEGASYAVGSRGRLFLFPILSGLSMGYQVFVVSRIKETAMDAVLAGWAVLDGVDKSANAVTSAAVVMVTVIASFMLLHQTKMK